MTDRKITRYTLSFSTKIDDIIMDVNQKIKEGWQPLGSICANVDGNNEEFFYQVMVKYE